LDGDISNLMENRYLWQDGEAGGMWLTGTHNAGWSGHNWMPHAWVKSGKNKPDINTVELLNINFNKSIELAADRIDKLFWFGILEDIDRSMALLSYQIGYKKTVSHASCHWLRVRFLTTISTFNKNHFCDNDFDL